MSPLRLAALRWPHPDLRAVQTCAARLLAVVLACLAGGALSAALPADGLPAGAVWLPAGVTLAAMLRWGPGMWPAVAAAAFLLAATPGWPAAAGAIAQAAVAVAVGWSLDRAGFRSAFDRVRDLGLFLLGAGGAAVGLGAIRAMARIDGGHGAPALMLAAWSDAALADAAGMLALGVPLLTASRVSLRRAFGRRRWPWTLLLWAAAGACGALALRHGGAPWSPLLFLPHLLLAALALRSGPFAAAVPALALAAGAGSLTAMGLGPFGAGSPVQALGLLWGYAGTLCLTPIVVAALAGERYADGERWRLALDRAHIGAAEWDVANRAVTLSRRWLAMLGHRTQSFGRTAVAVAGRVHREDRRALGKALVAVRRPTHDGARVAFRMQCNDGTWKWLEGHATVSERGRDGAPMRVLVIARDVTAQRAAQERHQLSAKLFQHLHEGLLITDAGHRVLDANPAFSAITGYTREEMLGSTPAVMRPAEPGSAAERQQATMLAALQQAGSWRGEVQDCRRDGTPCTLQVAVSAVKSPHGEARYHAWSFSDVTQARVQREQLERQAHTDGLTGLPNRARLAQLLHEAMREAQREGFMLTVCYLDLDHFKPVNDRFGHAVGDRLLVDLAERLRRSLRHWASGDDAVARLGGDEFVLLLRTATPEEGRHAVARVMRHVSAPYALGVPGGPVSVTASIGATIFPVDAADADTLLRHADHAMYGAKQAGRNGYLFFDAEHHRRAEQHFEAVGRVQDALDANQFELYYQPTVDLRRGKVLGVEALLRWKHPQHGVIAPSQFLPLIEHTGLSARLGDWVLQEGIGQLAAWLRQGLDLTVSINVSAHHLQEPTFGERLAGLLARHASPVAHRLVVEVLETAALADVDYTSALMQDCRALGVRFALDDFGTGYSTFTYLKRLPLDLLKIDRSFVQAMLTDRHDLAIVEGVIGLSETFGCTVVAEGVESSEQARKLLELGCDVGQGNGIAQAMPASEVAGWVRGYRDPFVARGSMETAGAAAP